MKIPFLYLFLSLLSLHSYCQDNPAIDEGGLFWRISGNGLSNPSFLLGTNHAMHYYYLDSIPGVRQALNSVNQIVSEVSLESSTIQQTPLTDDIIAFALPGANTRQRNKTALFNYNDCLDEDDFEYLQSIYQSFSGKDNLESTKLIPLDLFDWFNRTFYSAFEQKFDSEESEFKSNAFFLRNYMHLTEAVWIDYYLQKEAVHRNYSIIGLETLSDREQLKKELAIETAKIKTELNTDTSACTLAKNLVEYLKIKEEKGFVSYIYKLHELYMNQDIRSVEQIKGVEADFDTLLLYDVNSRNKLSRLNDEYSLKIRNQNWMSHIPQIINNHPSFIAVGLAHLPGKYGLINLLRNKGYIVEPIKQVKETTPISLTKGILDIRKENIEYEFNILEQTPYNEEWLNKFKTLTLYAYSWFGDKYLDRFNELKSKITEEDKIKNQDSFEFYLRPRFSKRDTITDLIIYDTEGNKKQLLEIIDSDKYSVLCFWKTSDWCINQLLEISELTKIYKDKLDIIYINIDNDILKWKESNKRINLEKYNFMLNAEDGNAFSRYLESSVINEKTVNYYYLVSPEGKILNIQPYFFHNHILSLYIKP